MPFLSCNKGILENFTLSNVGIFYFQVLRQRDTGWFTWHLNFRNFEELVMFWK